MIDIVLARIPEKSLTLQKMIKESVFYMTNLVGQVETIDVMENLASRTRCNSKFTMASTINTYNDILSRFPEAFRGELRKSIYGTEFGDIPFFKVSRAYYQA